MTERTRVEAFSSAADVSVGDLLCLSRRRDPAEDVWDEVVQVEPTELFNSDRVTLWTRVLGRATYLSNDRVTVRRAVPDDDLVAVLAYGAQSWWSRQETEAEGSLGGSDDEPDADDWMLAQRLADYVRRFFVVEPLSSLDTGAAMAEADFSGVEEAGEAL